VVDGVFVAGGQLTQQKYPHAWEMGYWVHKQHQRRGYGMQAAQSLLGVAFTELKAHRVFAKTFSNNVASLRILVKLGMRREGVLRDVGFKDGVYYDEHWFGMLAHEWRGNSAGGYEA
jgi:ribosomal-protein-alanine N-acetyltransferase